MGDHLQIFYYRNQIFYSGTPHSVFHHLDPDLFNQIKRRFIYQLSAFFISRDNA